jgi:thiosulfate/3-mercaptopyruvate sulfurtransferase
MLGRMDINISPTKVSRRKAIRLALCAFAAPAVAVFGSRLRLIASAAGPELLQQVGGAQDFPPASVLEPNQLAALLSRTGDMPTVICVGFKFLYDTAHVPGSLYLGPARDEGGLAALEKWAGSAPRNKAVVLYCGCCPWDKCPNIRPAYAALKNMGFSQLKVVRMNQDFARDWVEKGLPTEKK